LTSFCQAATTLLGCLVIARAVWSLGWRSPLLGLAGQGFVGRRAVFGDHHPTLTLPVRTVQRFRWMVLLSMSDQVQTNQTRPEEDQETSVLCGDNARNATRNMATCSRAPRSKYRTTCLESNFPLNRIPPLNACQSNFFSLSDSPFSTALPVKKGIKEKKKKKLMIQLEKSRKAQLT
jgi:hypothetical protein